MKTKKVIRWMCPHCGDVHKNKESGAMCCGEPMDCIRWKCGICNCEYYNKEDAEICCEEE